MGDAFFYHMTHAPLEDTLPVLLTKALERGWKVALRGRDPALLDRLDQRLWLLGDESFLPHGRAGGPHDAAQPILLTEARAAPNGAECLVAVDGAEVSPEEVAAHERVMILFDGNDPAALDVARGQWRSLVAGGCKAKYWSQESGRWEMKAESGGGA